MPLLISRAIKCARCKLRVHRPAPKPYSVLLAIANASSSVLKVSTVTKGPNTSSCAIRSWVDLARTIVGST